MADAPWWADAVVYQVYVRSFADANGDGTGDLEGVLAHLDHLESLGVDAIWFTPWYASPMADGGYDVADYRAIDPAFGDLATAERLIAEASARGIRTIVDIVPNHVSDRHPWFRAALAAEPGSDERARFWFRPGRGACGELPPTEWISSFGGPTWTRTTDPDGRPGEWYLHVFSPAQPDLNWDHPAVRAEHEDVLRFWFDRGAAGIRVDSAAMLVKDASLPVAPAAAGDPDHPHLDRDGVHEIYRAWRAVADEYDDPRLLVGEVWLADPARFARYLRDDELHGAFNFEFMTKPWDASALRATIAETLDWHEGLSATPTWALSNHDLTRPATRYGRADSSFSFEQKRFGTPTDHARGLARARAAAMLAAFLPGSLYIYQGDELGLPEVEDLPDELRQDPMFARSGGVDPGRDGCRVPLPWTRAGASLGFSPTGAAWLPQPAEWAGLSVEAQARDEASTLSLYRRMLRLRRDLVREGRNGASPTGFAWAEHPDPDVIALRRGDILHLTNLGSRPAALPPHRDLLLASAPDARNHLERKELPADTSVWLRT
ncbi:glycoside hydrolase family 13 protein [Agromyces intestinalis]|uniref:Glycoside hydrolase family 13 protein n=1 Tax=Agromyces intestinalis TaxID=2592652 RepID=A0A5C1YLP7_9MICO|nr:glycoside hydrolase family 13 protein [Agromyces intestinalis]QEO16109.1 glycoside hydrolase family 13 protein [Agromyces intestinalis]